MRFPKNYALLIAPLTTAAAGGAERAQTSDSVSMAESRIDPSDVDVAMKSSDDGKSTDI